MPQGSDEGGGPDNRGIDPATARELAATLNARTARWAVGTSLLFEAVIVSIAAWLFCRRDY